MFPTEDKNQSVPDRELAIGRFWKEHGIYEKSLAMRDGAKSFVFYEGPPTANGMPHPGHCLTRAIKDLFPRYRTMRGERCERKAGWDTHGLPVEVEVCKELGIHAKEEIEAYGIEPFIQKCQQSVWRYMREWEQLTERLGFWIHLDEAYVTYHQSYVESVWWSLKNLFDRGLLYQGHKIVWWWAQGGTALSAGEVGQGYREVADPSVYVRFPIVVDEKAKKLGLDENTSLLVWTTTPWTLPSNQFVAINPELEYVKVADLSNPKPNSSLIIEASLAHEISNKPLKSRSGFSASVFQERYKGEDLLHIAYVPPFQDYHSEYSGSSDVTPSTWLDVYWRVLPAGFVSADSGTGLVHIAPPFGEDDFLLWMDVLKDVAHPHFRFFLCVGPDGKFTDEAPEYCRGRWVKDCDKDIIRDLKERGLLFHREQYLHDYPFCWRAEDDPLIQYPRESWFIRTTQFKEAMLENNSKINWLPEHIQEGRFGNFLESNVDWALSRERYWGTPLPIWVCSETGKKEAVDSYEALLAKPGVAGTEVWDEAKSANPELPDDLRVHKPYIDAVTYDSPFAKGARMHRVSEVIDCWYDSGAMPFAQWGYRGQETGPERERFEAQFPADFISEAIDQTRGWFYSQLAISTLMFGEALDSETSASRLAPSTYPHPYRNCIVLGLMLGEDGQKMSKSKRNYLAPDEIFDHYGADALRWYFFANQPPWTSIRYSEQAIKDSIPEFLLRLWNVYSFFTIYANIDEFDPSKELPGEPASAGGASPMQLIATDLTQAPTYRPLAERSELDRWILSELASMSAGVVERMDAYDNFGACQLITQFVDALSNWYVRRSRDRFWASDKRDAEKLDAYWTLYECLTTTAKVIAPFVPYLAESLWQNLATAVFNTDGTERVLESVHLCDYPTGDSSAVDVELSERMNLVRQISSLGRQARTSAQLKVRQPLARVEVILADTTHQSWLEEHAGVIADELNVKQVEFSDEPEKYVEYEALPNFKLLGPRLGKLMPKVKKALGGQNCEQLLSDMQDNGKISLTVDGQDVELTSEEVEFRIKAREGWTAANDRGVVVVLATELTDDLVAEGLARDLVRVIQDQRKVLGCDFTDRIDVGVVTESTLLATALEAHGSYIRNETLANSLKQKASSGCTGQKVQIGDADVELYVQVSP